MDSEFTEPYCLIHAGVTNFVKNGQLYNPSTARRFLATSRDAGITPNAAAINYFNAYPPPIRAGVVNNFLTHEQQFTHYNTFDRSPRLESHVEGPVAFVRFSYDNSAFTKTPELGTLPSGFGTGSSYTHARAYGLGETHIFTAYDRQRTPDWV